MNKRWWGRASKNIHYSSDFFAQLSHYFPLLLQLFLDLFLFLPFSWLISLPFTSPCVSALFVYSPFRPLFIFIFLDKGHSPCIWRTHTHIYAFLQQTLGMLSMQTWYRCPTATQTANIISLSYPQETENLKIQIFFHRCLDNKALIFYVSGLFCFCEEIRAVGNN